MSEYASSQQHPVPGVRIQVSSDSDTGLIMIYSISEGKEKGHPCVPFSYLNASIDAIISCFAPGDEELPSQRKLPPEKAGASQDTMSAQRSLFLR